MHPPDSTHYERARASSECGNKAECDAFRDAGPAFSPGKAICCPPGHSASPIYADGRIYFLSEEGESVVIAPGKQFRKLAVNQLDGQTLASMAVSEGSIFIRTATHLYRLGNP